MHNIAAVCYVPFLLQDIKYASCILYYILYAYNVNSVLKNFFYFLIKKYNCMRAGNKHARLRILKREALSRSIYNSILLLTSARKYVYIVVVWRDREKSIFVCLD